VKMAAENVVLTPGVRRVGARLYCPERAEREFGGDY